MTTYDMFKTDEDFSPYAEQAEQAEAYYVEERVQLAMAALPKKPGNPRAKALAEALERAEKIFGR